ncbi:hypothetical protein C3747_28g220 [Trypanosoma cruzi]|uniref:Papain-like cysteine peptidase n=2 Tax=Trypanosoma cruzi TaxID=5693 RepID=Q4DZ81_TRYCC|nr:hypothetical protein, conserved [Trypanosoma cruzi]EAN97812.1 hypothetical protein, conserved [Trypanosoma cruzi]PWV15745.1 hypothetical protein C3747_28g220 [Trypanosoma cruzi]|eukprot:XP_819663.1 hypothetical protein [Trypanosoma cruzi strain CL Brener]
MRRWVSLGGWCGPGLMLSKLGIRPVEEQLPFDMARCSFDGLLEFTRNGFDNGFFPGPLQRRPFTPDPASVWLLFRGQHACITHFDINADEVVQEFKRRFDEWEKMITCPTRPVTFLRTCIAENARNEVELVPQWHALLREKSAGKLDFCTVMVMHDQGPTTERVASFAEEDAAGSPCVVWNLAFDKQLPVEASLFDKCHDGYAQIIREMNRNEAWYVSTSPLRLVSPKPYKALCLVEGVPALRGSCTGFGTTHSALLGRCLYCGSTNGHEVVRDAFDSKKPWDNAEDTTLLAKWITSNGDKVAAVEATALELKRGANEVLLRLQQLIQS